MVRRAGGGAQAAELLVEEATHGVRVEDRLRLLEEERLVGAAATLGHQQEVVLVAVGGVEVDLGGQVGAGVLLVPGRERCHLRVAQVEPGVGVEDALAQRLAVTAAGDDALALLAHHDGGAGVLAHRQDAAGGDVGVLQQVEGDEPVVGAGLGVVEDVAQLLQVAGAQVVRDVVHALVREPGERVGVDAQERLARDVEGLDTVGGEQPVGRLLRCEREQVGVDEVGHGARVVRPDPCTPRPGVHPSVNLRPV